MSTGKDSEGVPQSFGRFKVLRPLGRGGMGLVYLAEDPVIGRKVAIKVVKTEDSIEDEERVELQSRFEREFQSAGKLDHPNIVTVYDVGNEGGSAFFAMEYLPGDSLADILKSDQVLSFKDISDFAAKVCSGLDYAHDHRVVHRDIKPANILINRSGEPKITDFGVAKLTSTSLTRTGTVVGTPSYMSPEQVTGQPVSGASDQFSVAVILYHMLTGELPFTGDNPTTILYKIVHETPARPHERKQTLPTQIDQVLLRALDKKPENRYPRCLDLANAVRDALGVAAQELDLAFDQPDSTLQMRHQKHRKPGRKWLAPVLGAVAVGALAFFALQEDSPICWRNLQTQLFGGESGERARSEPIARTIFVQADQGGAAIWKDGTDTGLFVPAEVVVEGAVGDQVELELRRSGRIVAATSLVLDPAMSTEWSTVETAPPPETFSVSTRPEGAKVFLNDELSAGSTPVGIQLVAGESYNLRVELEDYHTESTTFRFPDDLDPSITESKHFFFPLREQVPPAFLEFAAPYTVTVEVAGESHGPRRQHEIRLKPGTYDVRLTSDEVFLDQSRQLEFDPGQRQGLSFPEAVEVRVAAQPGNCRVSINGRQVDETPFTQRLVPNTYEFRFDWPALGEAHTTTETVTADTGEIFGSPESP